MRSKKRRKTKETDVKKNHLATILLFEGKIMINIIIIITEKYYPPNIRQIELFLFSFKIKYVEETFLQHSSNIEKAVQKIVAENMLIHFGIRKKYTITIEKVRCSN